MRLNKSASAALADNASGTETLGLQFADKNIERGAYVPRAEAQSPPTLSYKGSGTYVVVGLDMDAPFPSFDVLGPILHWIQPGLKASADDKLRSEGVPFVANYIGPAPPPGSSPHRYCFFLYEQPADFDGKKYAPPNGETLPNMKRMRFSLDDFEKNAKLGKIIAVNFFRSS